MRLECNQSKGLRLPEVFCWTKYGDEAGETSGAILERKEIERRRNGGVFLWGIGQSIRPSLLALLQSTSTPYVLFSPIKSPASIRDKAPANVILWCNALGYDGEPFEFPSYSVVTSRSSESSGRKHHFALVCKSVTPITPEADALATIPVGTLSNLTTGIALGSSQVTSVVRRNPSDPNGSTEYPVMAIAQLIYPYFLRLCNGVSVPRSQRLTSAVEQRSDSAIEYLLKLRRAESVYMTTDPLLPVNA